MQLAGGYKFTSRHTSASDRRVFTKWVHVDLRHSFGTEIHPALAACTRGADKSLCSLPSRTQVLC